MDDSRLLTRSQINELADLFAFFAVDGYISVDGLKRVTRCIDEKMSSESLASFIANWSDKGAISWPDFLRMLSFTSQRFDSSEEMREVFRMLDHDNDGRIEVRRLRAAIETLEPQLSVQQVTELIMNAFPERAGSYRDFYQNGTIDFNEFVAFMHSS